MIWAKTTKENEHKLQKLVNFGCQIIFRLPKQSHVSVLIKELEWLDAPTETEHQVGKFLYKLFNAKLCQNVWQHENS